MPESLPTVAVSCVTRVAELGDPVTMARRMLATPGMVTVLSMLLTVMSSAHAYLSGNTFMTKLEVWASSKAVTAAMIWLRYAGGPVTTIMLPPGASVAGSWGENTADCRSIWNSRSALMTFGVMNVREMSDSL